MGDFPLRYQCPRWVQILVCVCVCMCVYLCVRVPILVCSDITNEQVGISGVTVPGAGTSIFIDLIPITPSCEGWF